MQIQRLAVPPLRCALPVGIVLAGLSATGCHSREQLSPSPCQGLAANPLTFQFAEAFGTPTPDTAYNDQVLTMRGSASSYTSYEWQIGPADQRTGQNIVVAFDAQTQGPIPVRLIAKRPLNTACFPKDDGVDTLTKVLTLVPGRAWRAPIYGKFRGANRDTPTDTFTVRVYMGPNFFYPNDPGAEPTNYLVGLPKGCQDPHHNVRVNWRGFSAMNGTNCSRLDSKGYLTTRDSIHIEYRTQVAPTVVDKVFLGKRVK